MNKHLHPDILKRIEEQEKQGGVKLDELKPGTKIWAQTFNSLYIIEVLENGRFMVNGGTRFTAPQEVAIAGATWGGSMIKPKWLCINMAIEMEHPDPNRSILLTSAVQSIKVIAPDGSWEYKL